MTRSVRLVDRYGAGLEGEATIDEVARLLDTIAADDGDDEHRSVSLTDSDEWNLEFYPDEVVFENVDEDGEEVGELAVDDRATRLAIAAEFLAGDFDALRARPWA